MLRYDLGRPGHDRFHFADSQRPLDDRALAEAALPGAAAHDLDRDPIVNAFDERHDRRGRQRRRIQIADHRGLDRLGTSPGAIERSEPAVVEILRLVKPRNVSKRQSASQPGQHLLALPPPRFSVGKASVGPAFLAQPEPLVAQQGQARLSVAGDEHIDKRRHRFGVLRARPAGDDQRMVHRALRAAEWNPPQVEHRQDIAGADLVLQRESENVEIGQRRECLQAVERLVGLAQQPLHIVPGREGPFADPIVAVVHQRVKNLQAMMAHPDCVGIGKGEAELAAHRAMVLANHIQLAADILSRRLNPRQDVTGDEVFELGIEHVGTSVKGPLYCALPGGRRQLQCRRNPRIVGHVPRA